MYFLSNTQIYKNAQDFLLKKGFKSLKLLTFLVGFQQKTPAKNDRRF